MWSDIIAGVKAIGGWVQLNRENRSLQRQELIDALCELHHAANLTRAFAADASIHGYEEAQGRFRDISSVRGRWDLSEAWREVARKLARLSDDPRMREVFEDLYMRCFAKAQFWADPKGYRDSGFDIALGQLVDEVAQAIEHARHGVFR